MLRNWVVVTYDLGNVIDPILGTLPPKGVVAAYATPAVSANTDMIPPVAAARRLELNRVKRATCAIVFFMSYLLLGV
jgi:hypothetical protein